MQAIRLCWCMRTRGLQVLHALQWERNNTPPLGVKQQRILAALHCCDYSPSTLSNHSPSQVKQQGSSCRRCRRGCRSSQLYVCVCVCVRVCACPISTLSFLHRLTPLSIYERGACHMSLTCHMLLPSCRMSLARHMSHVTHIVTRLKVGGPVRWRELGEFEFVVGRRRT